MKMNCWEFKKCGRHLEGPEVDSLGVCPAATDTSHHGINCGKNSGRHCWWVAGTFCGGQPQGTWASKLTSCAACDFFKLVKEEEGDNFQV